MRAMPESVRRAIQAFQKLPGVGQKSAERLVYALLKRRREDAMNLSRSIADMMDRVLYCRGCRNYSESEQCPICSDNSRNADLLCVVEQPEDVLAIERTGEFRGRYFVLHGSIAPLDGIGPEELGVDQLLEKVQTGSCRLRDPRNNTRAGNRRHWSLGP